MLRQRCTKRDQKGNAVFNKSYLVSVAFKEIMENDKGDRKHKKDLQLAPEQFSRFRKEHSH